jgi:hypothetical protein
VAFEMAFSSARIDDCPDGASYRERPAGVIDGMDDANPTTVES